MNSAKILVSALFLSASVGVAQAAVLDNFNRPDSATLGSNWTQQAGSSGISGNQAQGTNLSLATLNGSSGNTVSFDISQSAGGTSYIAAVIGYGLGQNFFIKVQNNGSSAFNTYGFYQGNNDGGFFGSLSSSFTAAHVTASVVGSLATLTIDPVGGLQQVYTQTYSFSYSGGENGLGFYGNALADNFGTGGVATAAPEASTWAMMLIGLAGLGFAGRRRLATRAA